MTEIKWYSIISGKCEACGLYFVRVNNIKSPAIVCSKKCCLDYINGKRPSLFEKIRSEFYMRFENIKYRLKLLG